MRKYTKKGNEENISLKNDIHIWKYKGLEDVNESLKEKREDKQIHPPYLGLLKFSNML